MASAEHVVEQIARIWAFRSPGNSHGSRVAPDGLAPSLRTIHRVVAQVEWRQGGSLAVVSLAEARVPRSRFAGILPRTRSSPHGKHLA
jgi:hypothetical protein